MYKMHFLIKVLASSFGRKTRIVDTTVLLVLTAKATEENLLKKRESLKRGIFKSGNL